MNQCADCHRLGQNGSRVGPDLSAVGDNRTPSSSARDRRSRRGGPSREPQRARRVEGRDHGRRPDPQPGCVQHPDADVCRAARVAPRDPICGSTRSSRRGLMPSYEGKLDSQDVADIVRYPSRRGSQPTAASTARPAKSTTHERILNAEREPQNWLTYGGNYSSHRFSPLDQITRENVGKLTLKWDLASEVSRQDGNDADRRRRRDVRRAEQRGRGDGRRDRAGVLDLPLPRASGVERVPDGREGRRVLGGPRVLGDLRRPSHRDRCEDRQGDLAQDRLQLQGRACSSTSRRWS